MDTHDTDKAIRSLYHRLEPRVNAEDFCRTLDTHLVSRKGRPARGRPLRAALVACLALVCVAAVGAAVYAAVTYVGQPHQVIVIADAPTSTSGSSTTTTAFAREEFDFQGLWAGNVQTVPERPVSLPSQFYQEPGDPAQLVMGEPLWVFAGELTSEEAAAAVKSVGEEQTVLIFDPSEELCELLDAPSGQRPSSVGELPSVFTQRPVLIRSKVFAEVGPYWRLDWAQLGDDGSDVSRTDPEAVYSAAVAISMLYEEERQGIEENKRTQATEEEQTATTSPEDPYPIPRTVESKEAEALAQKAADYLRDLTGERVEVKQALEDQLVGPNEVLEHRGHDAVLTEPVTERSVDFSVFWSAEDQLAYPPSSDADRGLHVRFDAGAGSKGVLAVIMGGHGYQCILQLGSGITANVVTGGRPLDPIKEASLLTPEELITFTKWLVGQAGYLHP
jgi:hypothetical protein